MLLQEPLVLAACVDFVRVRWAATPLQDDLLVRCGYLQLLERVLAVRHFCGSPPVTQLLHR